MRDNTLPNQSSTNEVLRIVDQTQGQVFVESDCSPPTSTINSVVAGSAPDALCTYYDGEYYSIPFTPNKAISGGVECTDGPDIWHYSINQTPISAVRDHLKVSIDVENSLIWVKGLVGETATATYIITVNGVLEGTTKKAAFDFTLLMTPCKNTPLIPPTFVDQLYYVTDPVGSYDAPDFTVDPICPQDLTYNNTITPANTWITDNAGVGKLVSWQTNDEINKNIYTVTIGVTNICVSALLSYTLDV